MSTSTLSPVSQADAESSANLVAAFKAVFPGISINGSGKIVLDQAQLTQAQFVAAIHALFGAGSADAAIHGSWTPGEGFEIKVEQFKTLFRNVQIEATSNQIWINREGAVNAKFQGALTAMLGKGLEVSSDGTLEFRNSQFLSATLAETLKAKFGDSGSITAELNATVTREGGVQSATFVAAYKALLGKGSVNTSEATLTFGKGKLTEAEFTDGLKAVFRNGLVQGELLATWKPGVERTAELKDFKAVFENFQIDAGTNQIRYKKDGSVDANLEAALTATFGSAVQVSSSNAIEFRDSRFVSATIADSLEAKFGDGGSVTAELDATIRREGLESAKFVAAYKALLGGESVNTAGAKLLFEKGKLTEAQFTDALKAVFADGQVKGDLLATWSPGDGLTAEVRQFRALFENFEIDAAANRIRIKKDGTLDADLRAALTARLGKGVEVSSSGAIEFRDSQFVTATLAESLKADFGENGSITAELNATVTREECVKSAKLVAAYKALLGEGSVNTSEASLTFEKGKLTEAQFTDALKTVFGKGKVEGNLLATWKPGDGLTAELKQFKAVFENFQIDAGTNQIRCKKDGSVDADLQAALTATLGKGVQLSSSTAIEFRDSRFVSATLADSLEAKLGDTGSISAEVAATITREGLESAKIVAAYKTLLGGESVNTAGGTLTFEKGRLTEAQFTDALKSVFRKGQVQGNLLTTWKPDDGLTAEVKQFKAVFENFQVDAATNKIQFKKDGTVDASLQAALTATLGNGVQVSSSNAIEFRDSRFVSATLADSLQADFGERGSITAELNATINRDGVKSANLVAAYKTLQSGSKYSTTVEGGFTLENNKLSTARFKAAVGEVFGEGSIEDAVDIQWNSAAASLTLGNQFKGVWEAVALDAGGTLRIQNGKKSGDLQARITTTLGSQTTLSSDNTLVFRDDAFVSATLKESLNRQFGAHGSLEATIEATVTQKGLEQATLFAATKSLVGQVEFNSATKLTIRNGTIEKVTASLAVLAGSQVKANAAGEVTLDGLGRFKSSEFAVDVQTVISGTKVDAGGSWTYEAGKPFAGKIEASASRMLGQRVSLDASGSIQFNGSGLNSVRVQESLTVKNLNGDNLSVGIVYHDGKIDGQLQFAAVQQLKVLSGKSGSIEIHENGTVEIKDGKIDRGEVSALVSVAAGESLNLSTEGHLIYKRGEPISAEIAHNLSAVWGATTLNASGKLEFKNGNLKIADGAALGAHFKGANVNGDASITFVNPDQQKLDFRAKALGGKLDSNGSLVLDKGHIQAGSLSTNLVVGSAEKPDYKLRGLVAVSKSADGTTDAKLDLGVELNTGVLSISAGVSSEIQVGPAPADSLRTSITSASGGQIQFQQWTGEFKVHAAVGATAQLGAAGIPFTVGIRSSGSESLNATAITTTPISGKSPGFLTVLYAPETAADVLRMHPGESWEDSAVRTFLVGGNVEVGWTVPGGSVTLGSDVSYSVTSEVRRKLVCTAPGIVQVELALGKGETTVETFKVGAKLDIAGNVPKPGSEALAQILKKAGPLLEEAGKLSYSRTWTQSEQDHVFFKFGLDLTDAAAREALTHLLHDDYAKAQGAARTSKGVVLESAGRERVRTKATEDQIKAFGLNARDWSQWQSTKSAAVVAGQLQFTEEIKGDSRKKSLLPWNANWSSQVRLIHQQTKPIPFNADQDGDYTGVASSLAIGHSFAEGDARTMKNYVTLQLIAHDHKASLLDVQNIAGTGSALLDLLEIPVSNRGSLGDFARVLDGNEAILKHLSFGDAVLNVQALISPDGLVNILNRTWSECRKAYLQIAGRVPNRLAPLVVSPWGIAQKVARSLGCEFSRLDNGSYEFRDTKTKVVQYSLSQDEMSTLQDEFIKVVPSTLGLSLNSREGKAVHSDAGTWHRHKPVVDWLFIDRTEGTWGRTILDRARQFADAIQKAREVAQPLLDPASIAAVDTNRLYDELNELFEKAVAPNMAARLAVVGLAGKGVFVRGGLAVAEEAIAKLKESGLQLETNPQGADVTFAVGGIPTLPDLAGTFGNLDLTNGGWMDRAQTETKIT